MAEVSVVIPTHSRWPMLQRALTSARGQEDVELELIVVDDGSTDETPSALAAIDDPRLRVVRNETGGGPARARNRGMAEASGEWIAWLDDDDIWAPTKLRAQLDAAARTGAGFVWCSAFLIDGEGRTAGFEPAPAPDEFVRRVREWNPMPGGCSTAMARADAVRAAGEFDPALVFGEDWDYWIRILEHVRPAAVDEVLAAYVVHTGSTILRAHDTALESLERLAAKHRSEGEPDRFDRVAFCDWVATGLRREGRRVDAARLFARVAREERSLKAAGLAARTLLGDWAVELPRRRWRPPIPPRPAWLDAAV